MSALPDTAAVTAQAPLFTSLADGPADGQPAWLTTDDGIRVRVVSWVPVTAKATILLFPGRTEYCEKYGRAATDLAARGFAVLTIDWRGQGLADRLLDDPGIGHVGKFSDYQKDVAAMIAHAKDIGLPAPFFLLAHSMGGAIGLRALMDGLDVNACAFTGPMWGIGLSPMLRPIAVSLGALSRAFGMADRLAPGQSSTTYVVREPFEGNTLTNDPEMFGWMKGQLAAQPELALGGPSLHWLHEALGECRAMATKPSPNVPCLTFLGTQEAIVDRSVIHTRMHKWPNGELMLVPNCQHEVLMENEEIRTMAFDKLDTFFSTHVS